MGKHLWHRLTDTETVLAIPHEQLGTYKFKPFKKFYFLSTYGNIAGQTDVSKIMKANIADLSHVLAFVRETAGTSIMFMSSSSVTLPVQTSYSRAKHAAEEMIKNAHVPYMIVRPYSVTGVGEQSEHLIPTLIRSCMEGASMELVPDAVHDYVDVEDLVDGIIQLDQRDARGTFEFGGGRGTDNTKVVELVEKACGKKANITVVKQLRDYDNTDWVCRNPAEGWKPKKALEQSIQEMVSAYKNETQ